MSYGGYVIMFSVESDTIVVDESMDRQDGRIHWRYSVQNSLDIHSISMQFDSKEITVKPQEVQHQHQPSPHNPPP